MNVFVRTPEDKAISLPLIRSDGFYTSCWARFYTLSPPSVPQYTLVNIFLSEMSLFCLREHCSDVWTRNNLRDMVVLGGRSAKPYDQI